MPRSSKVVVVTAASLALVAGLLALAVPWIAERKRTRIVEIDVAPVAFATDEASVKRGEYLFRSRGCMECHGASGAGAKSSTMVPGCTSGRRTSAREPAAW